MDSLIVAILSAWSATSVVKRVFNLPSSSFVVVDRSTPSSLSFSLMHT